MNKLDEIRNRSLSENDRAKIAAMAGETVEEQVAAPAIGKTAAETIPVNDVEFYGARVMEFYDYLSDKASQSTAANLTIAAATLKASVVLGGLIKDLTEAITDRTTSPAIPVATVKLPYAGKKRGRKPKVK